MTAINEVTERNTAQNLTEATPIPTGYRQQQLPSTRLFNRPYLTSPEETDTLEALRALNPPETANLILYIDNSGLLHQPAATTDPQETATLILYIDNSGLLVRRWTPTTVQLEVLIVCLAVLISTRLPSP